MSGLDVDVDAGHLAIDLAIAAARTAADMRIVVYRTGARMRTLVRANASGRPGPRVQTGDYRRSISQTNGFDAEVPTALVFTNSPQGRRLEYGFNGYDSAGRAYRQAPLPHWRPAEAHTQFLLTSEANALVARAIAKINGRTR